MDRSAALTWKVASSWMPGRASAQCYWSCLVGPSEMFWLVPKPQRCLTVIQTHFIVTSASELGWWPRSRWLPCYWLGDRCGCNAVLENPFLHCDCLNLWHIYFLNLIWHQPTAPSLVKSKNDFTPTNSRLFCGITCLLAQRWVTKELQYVWVYYRTHLHLCYVF